MRDFGIDTGVFGRRSRPLIRYCLDWSEQRHHLAGGLGAALAQRLFALGWVKPAERGRAVHLADAAATGLRSSFGIELGGPGGVGPSRARSHRAPSLGAAG